MEELDDFKLAFFLEKIFNNCLETNHNMDMLKSLVDSEFYFTWNIYKWQFIFYIFGWALAMGIE
jgi:hypothetical protein